MDPLNLFKRVLLSVVLACVLFFENCGGYIKTPDLKITYTNEFKFELRDINYSSTVKRLGRELGFVYKIQIVEEFFLYIRDDVPRFSAEPYDGDKLKEARDKLRQYVISIEQDYERQWISLTQDGTAPQDDEFTTPWATWRTGVQQENGLNPTPSSASLFQAAGPNCEKKAVNVAFIDYGFELKHPNLKHSANDRLSHEFFGDGNNVLPPVYGEDMEHDLERYLYEQFSHGTRCMGRVGATSGGGCDRGVAPNVKLVGLKAITYHNGLSDIRQARALSYRHDEIDIFSCSYGIMDNRGFYGPEAATQSALRHGATKSQDCRGVVYVFPSGNGHHDNCNADGYANSVDTITIAYVDRNGDLPKNVEICPAAIAATVGEGFNTTDLNNDCSGDFKGSSSSSAVAAGYAGELRFVSPCLSKRDIEHIMATTAVQKDDISWRTNGAGLKFNDQIGFGQLDLGLMKQAALNWKYVPERHTCVITPDDTENKHVTGTNWIIETRVTSNGCRDSPNFVRYLEHVQVTMTLRCSNISQVAIQLVSPAETVSNILTHINMTAKRVKQYRNLEWTFMSVNFWRELSDGIWVVKVIAEDAVTDAECEYSVDSLVLYGTQTHPDDGGGPLSCQMINNEKKNTDTSDYVGVVVAICSVIVFVIIVIAIAITMYVFFKKKMICCSKPVRDYQLASSEELSYTNGVALTDPDHQVSSEYELQE